MKTFHWAIALLWLATTPGTWAGGKPATPKPPEPLLVQEVDAATGQFAIGKSKSVVTTYALKKSFSTVLVNGKPADLSKVETGMRVLNITASGTNASRLEVEAYVPKTDAKKK